MPIDNKIIKRLAKVLLLALAWPLQSAAAASCMRHIFQAGKSWCQKHAQTVRLVFRGSLLCSDVQDRSAGPRRRQETSDLASPGKGASPEQVKRRRLTNQEGTMPPSFLPGLDDFDDCDALFPPLAPVSGVPRYRLHLTSAASPGSAAAHTSPAQHTPGQRAPPTRGTPAQTIGSDAACREANKVRMFPQASQC